MKNRRNPTETEVQSWIGKSCSLGDANYTVTSYRVTRFGSIMVYGTANSRYGIVKNRCHSASWLSLYI